MGDDVTRFIQSIIGVAFVCFMAWTAGYDFDTRGFAAFMVSYLAFAAFVGIYFFPRDDK